MLGLLISSSNSILLPLVGPEYSAVSMELSITTLCNLRATGRLSKMMLQSTVGDSALPLKALRAVGAKKDAVSVWKSDLFNTDPLVKSLT